MTCPITKACYTTIISHAKTKYGEGSLLVLDLEDGWSDLLEEIQDDEPVASALRLRGLYAVEFVRYHVLPQVWGTRARGVDFPSGDFRSVEGLVQLSDVCQKMRRRFVVSKGSIQLQFSNKRGTDEEGHLYEASSMEVCVAVLEKFIEMVDAQRRVMYDASMPATKSVGRALGFCIRNRSSHDQALCMRTLLQTNIHNPSRVN